MLYTIKNEQLTVAVDSLGAVFSSINKDGIEYIWQGDPKYWKRKDITVFPYVGRMTNDKYKYKDEEYSMILHGFCREAEFTLEEQTATSVSLVLKADDTTRAMYPFEFTLHVKYEVCDNRVIKTYAVDNTDTKTILFALGSHTGFNAPINGDGEFSDWYLSFDADCDPYRVLFNRESLTISGETERFPLADMNRIPLSLELFKDDAVVLGDIPRGVTLASKKSSHSLHISFPGMGYLSIWQAYVEGAKYLCIMPWASLPSHHGVVEDWEKQAHIVHLPVGQTYTNVFTFDIL